MPAATDAPVPLARLVAMTYRWLVDELHERLAADGWAGIRPAYGFVLLAVRHRSVTPTQLAAELGVTKQAASQLADAMVDDGLLTRAPDEHDARLRRLGLAPRGAELLDAVERIYVELEAECARHIGERALEQTRSRLTRLLRATHDGALPTIRPSP